MAGSARPVPAGLHTITPRLVCRDAARALEFYRDAFGAEDHGHRFTTSGGKVVHAELRIGDSIVYVTDEGDDGNGVAPDTVEGRVTTILAITVDRVDAWWQRAVDAGCEVVYPLANQFYGDRGGRLRDPFGHQWMLSMHIEDVDPAEVERRMQSVIGDD